MTQEEMDEKEFEEVIKTIPNYLIGYSVGTIWVNTIILPQKKIAKWAFLAGRRTLREKKVEQLKEEGWEEYQNG